MEYFDNRLPQGISIWKNDFDEYVAIKNGIVAKHEDNCIRASLTLEGAVQNYLTHNTKQGAIA